MKLLHLSDVQYCREHAAEALASLEVARETAARERVDLIVIAGDLFDRGLQASDRDAMPELIGAIRGLLEVTPIVAVQGTPTHDVPGCYEVLTHLEAPHNLTMLYPDTMYALYGCAYVAPWERKEEDYDQPECLILGCPEPGKEWLLSNRSDLGASDATQAAVDAMRALLLGLGSMRREHPDIPCVFVYHGAIRGATMGAGQTVGAHELAIGVEDLQLVGADYYALGHIHQAQQIGELPAYYAGSAYPVDWGELDQKGCYLVTVGPGPAMSGYRADVEPIPFLHPPRCKIEAEWSRDGLQIDGSVRGYQTWLAVTARGDFGAEEPRDWESVILQTLLEAGALPGSRVTVEKVPVETVRAREITEAQKLRDKVTVWAVSTIGADMPGDSILDKADAIEEEGRAAGVTGTGQHIRQRSLRLRGAKAILKGLGAQEVVFDLDRYDAGLIALVAPNGSGKTGLLSRFHPFPDSPPRSGYLHEHFALKDSASEFIWTDERTGTDYRSLILIDPTLSTPKTEYHLYRAERYAGNGEVGDHGWEPLTTGRKEAYLELITSMWGSIDLYMRSAYVPQWDTPKRPELGSATKDERQGLFVELGGLSRFEWYAKGVKAKADGIQRTVEVDQARADQIAEDLARRPEIEAELTAKRAEYETACTRQEEIEKRGKWQKTLVEDLALQVAEQREYVERRRGLTDEGSRLTLEAAGIGRRRVDAKKAVAGRADAESVVQQAADLERARGVLSEKRTTVATERERIMGEYARALAAHRATRDTIAQEVRRLEKYASNLEQTKARAVAQVDAIGERRAHAQVTCPQCEHVFAVTVLGEDDKLAELQEQILGLDNNLNTNERARKAMEAQLAASVEPKPPTLPTMSSSEAALLEAVAKALAALDLPAARETIRLADAAQAEIASGKRRAEEIAVRQIEIDRDRRDLLERIDETITAKHAEAKAEHERLQRAYVEIRERAAALNAQAEAFTSSLSELNAKAEAFTTLEEQLVKARSDLADWRYLERACGRDGIQALELDAMGPSVSAEATALLRVARDAGANTPFDAVRIVTQRMAGKGKLSRMVEAFTIECHDTRPEAAAIGEEWEDLGMICGGERVWLRAAIYQAFAVIRAQTTGLYFDVMILDEADHALDADARVPYLRMLERGHADSGRYQTLIVTHSPELQQAIGQRVEMRELARAAVPA